jgi:SWI/SNF-related matrix-associated actin-dependent regulator of chromatin subfamily A3
MLTRLRQLALHPGLVPSNYLEQLQIAEENDGVLTSVVKISPQDKIRLQGLLARAVEDNEECPVCFNILTNPRITGCAHSFCLDWCVGVIAS